jgi:hypothetical protein
VNEFYSHTTYPANGSSLSSAAMRAELDSVEEGFDKLPALAGQGGKVVRVKADGTGLEAAASDAITSSDVHAAASKTPPVDADEIPLIDSASSWSLKKLTWADLKLGIKNYYDSLTTTLTNKTIVAANNTITTAASGNLVATNLNAALAELQGDIDTRLVSSTAATTYAPIGAKYIVQTADAALSGEQVLGALATGMVKNTTTTGVLSIGVAGSDYSAGTSALATGILKSTTTTGALSIAAAGTDYLAPAAIGSTVQGYDANTAKINVAQNFTAIQRPDYATTAVSTTSSYSFAGADQVVNITLTNAITVTFAAPTGLVTGAYYTFILTAGDALARTFAWNAAWKFPGAAIKLASGSATSGGVDVITFLALSATTAAYVGHTSDCR